MDLQSAWFHQRFWYISGLGTTLRSLLTCWEQAKRHEIQRRRQLFWKSDAAFDTFFLWIASQRAPESSNPGEKIGVLLDWMASKKFTGGPVSVARGLWVARSSHNLSGSTVWSLGWQPPINPLQAMQQPCFVKTSWFVWDGKSKQGARTSPRSFARRGKHIMQWSIELILFGGVGSANGAGLALQWEPEKVGLLLQKQGTSVSWEDETFTLLHFIRVRILSPDVSWCIRGIFLARLQLWTDLWRHLKQVFSWWQCLSLPCWVLSGFHQVNSRLTSLLLEVQHLDDSHVP